MRDSTAHADFFLMSQYFFPLFFMGYFAATDYGEDEAEKDDSFTLFLQGEKKVEM